MFDNLFLALSMLSRIRTPRIKNIDYRASVVFFPVVGYLASAILFLAYFASRNLVNDILSKAIALAIYYFIFGFFHFDGLLDVVDGFMSSHKDKERIIKIMKEPTIGAFALLFGFFFLLLEFIGIRYLENGWYFFPVFGRIAMIMQIKFSKPYSDKGLGALFYPLKKHQFLLSMLFLIPFAFYWKFMVIGMISAALSFLTLRYYSKRKLGGFNGDVLGATAMLSEMIFVVLLNTI